MNRRVVALLVGSSVLFGCTASTKANPSDRSSPSDNARNKNGKQELFGSALLFPDRQAERARKELSLQSEITRVISVDAAMRDVEVSVQFPDSAKLGTAPRIWIGARVSSDPTKTMERDRREQAHDIASSVARHVECPLENVQVTLWPVATTDDADTDDVESSSEKTRPERVLWGLANLLGGLAIGVLWGQRQRRRSKAPHARA